MGNAVRITGRRGLGDTLVDQGLVTPAQLQEAVAEQRRTGKSIVRALLDLELVSPGQMADALSAYLGIPRVRWDQVELRPELARVLPERFLKEGVLPVRVEGSTLFLAMVDPMDVMLLDDVQAATGMHVVPLVATEPEIEVARGQVFSLALSTEEVVEQIEPEEEPLNEQELIDPNSPAVRMVNLILADAVQRRASDVHLEPQRDRLRVRFRIDGLLRDVSTVPRQLMPSVVSRVKVMAGLDIAEHRRPQDGQIQMRIGEAQVDMRVSVMPTIHGEKAVVRLLNRSAGLITLDQLGFLPEARLQVDEMLRQRQGLILLTGPTGSGKSTTLYAFLQALNTPERNIITVEDPVEYHVDGITQVQINPRAGITFANTLRSVLRQDPDVLMVGEIRDQETAQIAVRAALTGHLVLSTLHTNSAPGSVVRLMDMGVEPYLLSATLVGVVAQRLVRAVCRDCRTTGVPELTPAERSFLGPAYHGEPLAWGRGCQVCEGTGFRGRVLIEEVLLVDRAIRDHIAGQPSEDTLRQLAMKAGMKTLKESGIAKALMGITTVGEVFRALYSLDEWNGKEPWQTGGTGEAAAALATAGTEQPSSLEAEEVRP
ncbi:ATPase, T2SS/T4P/T4SS family [Carboxydochorda subterranea]|uniref:ATPase, T2SS/T4P/T4SS family n=1 Tax=Carboxydichorda subterranea TaxID=3109565 RepID=A0ABZ1BUQ0_9FIRM|nr:ATPase, T2SS/T4P/T4SS family [Limnochorda sp. L945t]WRP16350.1 ATPase, T2SS/T4P/T4SS family [Limnochorda sp. L945t]